MRMSQHSLVGRAVVKLAGRPSFARVAPSVVPRLDRFVHRMTGGRTTLSAGMVPTVLLTTIGARSGEPRTVPLACVPDGDDLYVVGSNFGRARHPAWTANLLARPRARTSFGGLEFEVDSLLLAPDERNEMWPRLLEVWPAYDTYAERSGRDLRMFRLSRV